MCDYDRLIDPVNNLYNNILVNCKYYDNFQFNVLSKKENTGLSIIHFNARSLNANFDHITDFMCTLNMPFDVTVEPLLYDHPHDHIGVVV